MPNPAFETTEQPFTAFRFEVVLNLDDPPAGISNPLVDAAFAECDGLEMMMEPKTVRQGGDNRRQVQLIDQASYGRVTLRRGMTGNLQLWQWFAHAIQPGHNARAQGLVTMKDAAGEDKLTFVLEDCLPARMRGPQLNAKDGLVAIEELQLVYAALTLRPAGQVGAGFGFGVGFSLGAGGASVSAGASLSVSGGPGLSANLSASAGFKLG